MNGAVLELVNSFIELGIIFDCKLDFRNHITAKLHVSWDLLNDGLKNIDLYVDMNMDLYYGTLKTLYTLINWIQFKNSSYYFIFVI